MIRNAKYTDYQWHDKSNRINVILMSKCVVNSSVENTVPRIHKINTQCFEEFVVLEPRPLPGITGTQCV